MRNIVYVSLLLFLGGCSGKTPEKTGLEGKLLPSFTLLLLDSSTNFNTSNIPSGMPIILMYFSPECPFCRAEIDEITEHMQSFKGVRFYMISNFPVKELKKYNGFQGLGKYPNILVGQDYQSYFQRYFSAAHIPYLAVYSRKKYLKQVIPGKVKIQEILNAVNEFE